MSGSFLAHLLHIETSLRIGGEHPVMTDQPETGRCDEQRPRQRRSSGQRVPEPPSVSAIPQDNARLVRPGL
jgi:hypothetical protein